jgi:hypothetical protein
MRINHECNIFVFRVLLRTSILKPSNLHSNRLEPKPSSSQCTLSFPCPLTSRPILFVYPSHFARDFHFPAMTCILPSTPEAFKFVRNIEEFEVLLCRYLPSAQIDNLYPLWNAYTLPLWLDFP